MFCFSQSAISLSVSKGNANQMHKQRKIRFSLQIAEVAATFIIGKYT